MSRLARDVDQILTQVLEFNDGSVGNVASIDHSLEVRVLSHRIGEAANMQSALPERVSGRTALFLIAGISLALWLAITAAILKFVL